MKLLIVGSRGITDFDLSPYVDGEVELIISGGASGIDGLAEELADRMGISKLILRPNYKKYSKGAPLVRNKSMVDIADKLLVIWDGRSRGTLYTVNYAKKCGKPMTLVTVDGKPASE